MLGGVDDVGRDADHAAVHVGRAAGQAGSSAVRVPASPLATSLTVPSPPKRPRRRSPRGGVAAQLGRVALALGVDGLDLEAALERVDDELLEPRRHRRRVRVDDDEHPPRRRRARERRGVGQPLERGAPGRRGPSLVRNTTTRPRYANRVARRVRSRAMIAADHRRRARRRSPPRRPRASTSPAAGRATGRPSSSVRAATTPAVLDGAAGPAGRAGRADALGRHGLDRGRRPAVGDALQRARRARHAVAEWVDRRAARRAARAAPRGAGARAGTRAGATTRRHGRTLDRDLEGARW